MIIFLNSLILFYINYNNTMTKSILNNDDMKNNKLKKNIRRLFNCYILSQNQNQNQNGGNNNNNNNDLSIQIKKKLDKKIAELITRLTPNKDLEGGVIEFISAAMVALLTTEIYAAIRNCINNTNCNLREAIKAILERHLYKKLTDIPFQDPYTTYESVLEKYKKKDDERKYQQQQQQQQQYYQPPINDDKYNQQQYYQPPINDDKYNQQQYYQPPIQQQQQQQQQYQPPINDDKYNQQQYYQPPINDDKYNQQQYYQPPINDDKYNQPPIKQQYYQQQQQQYKYPPPPIQLKQQPIQPIHPLQPIQDFFNLLVSPFFNDKK